MTLRQYLALMAVGTAISWSGVVLIVTAVDPADTQPVVFAILYVCLFLGLTGLLSILGFLLRVWLLRQEFLLSRQVLVSFRQAVMLSVLLVAVLGLQSHGLLNLLNGFLLVAALTLVEFFFISARPRH